MLSPTFKKEIARGIEKVIWDVQDDIVEVLAEELTDRVSETGKHLYKAASENKVLLDRIEKAIHKKTGIARKEIKKAFRSAQQEQAKFDGKIYGHPVKLTPEMAAIVQAQYEMTLGEFKNYARSTAQAACTTYYEALDKAYNQTVSGLKPWTKAFMDAVDEVGEGVTITYDSGVRTTPEVAIARSLRTGIAQMASQITATRAAYNDVTLFLTSAHDGARPTHEPWQGQVFWVDWRELAKRIPIDLPDEIPEASPVEKAKYKEFCITTEIGDVQGLEGANCRHSYGPFFEGSINPYAGMEYDQSLYDKEQKARAMERDLRKRKRQLKAEKASADKLPDGEMKTQMMTQIESHTAKMRAKVNKYYDFCKENSIKTPQEFRLYIGR